MGTYNTEATPKVAWLGLGALAILGLSAMLLALNWESLPQRWPVHWGFDGKPNRWSDRTWKGVYGPIIAGSVVALALWIMGYVGWRQPGGPSRRRSMLKMMNLVAITMALTFAGVALRPLFGFPSWVIIGITFALMAVVLVTQYREWTEAAEEDTIPPEAWRFGVFYFNPADPSLVVPKRFGMGYTLNFANRWSWFMLLLPFASAAIIIWAVR